MYLIVGLGNPEKEYANTRHNMGFNVINKIANEYKIEVTENKFDGLLWMGQIEGEKVILLKPQTFMNDSGKSVIKAKNFYKIPEENVLVIYDDIDLEPTKIRIRKKGSPGTHNGMKSVTECLGTQNFPRVRVGIGSPEHKGDLINYVIGKISKEEADKLDEGVEKAKEAVIEIIKNGIDAAMNKFN
ncbi:MAG: aminoacyl-tRNA hydrolase [Clostridia bacterium]|nr:aminoacyl-tRNA hydrolase [Clostridia bacterium]